MPDPANGVIGADLDLLIDRAGRYEILIDTGRTPVGQHRCGRLLRDSSTYGRVCDA